MENEFRETLGEHVARELFKKEGVVNVADILHELRTGHCFKLGGGRGFGSTREMKLTRDRSRGKCFFYLERRSLLCSDCNQKTLHCDFLV